MSRNLKKTRRVVKKSKQKKEISVRRSVVKFNRWNKGDSYEESEEILITKYI